MKQHKIPLANGETLEFVGEEIACATSMKNARARRWTELFVYQTDKGDFVAHTIGRTLNPGEVNIHRATVLFSRRDVVEWFGGGGLADEISNKLAAWEQRERPAVTGPTGVVVSEVSNRLGILRGNLSELTTDILNETDLRDSMVRHLCGLIAGIETLSGIVQQIADREIARG